MTFSIRKAAEQDVPVLRELIDASVRGLQSADYSPTQIESALASVYGVDSQLIVDGTYFVVETDEPEKKIVACGGWSQRKTLYGGDRWTRREDSLLNPKKDAAKIRAFFVHPAWVRRGIGTILLDACEQAALVVGARDAGHETDRGHGTAGDQADARGALLEEQHARRGRRGGIGNDANADRLVEALGHGIVHEPRR